MSLSCYYDYFAIQKAANSINELEINEPISCYPAYSGTYTLDKIKDLSSSDYSTNILNVSDRIKVYLDCVQSHLSSSSDIESVLSSVSIDLRARPLDIYIQDGTFSTKATSDTAYNNWVRLTAFWADIYRELIVPFDTTSYNETNLQQKIQYLFNNQTAFDTSAYSHTIIAHVDNSSTKTASSLAYMSDIQTELRSFMKTLSEIKLFQMNFRKKLTDIKTDLRATTAKPSKNNCLCTKSNLAEISQGPYKVIPSSVGYSQLPVVWNDKVLDQNILNLETLVKLNDARSEMPRTFSITDEGSNGILSYYTDIQETEFDLLGKADEIEKLFDLQTGSIISRKNILKAIDYIFFLWATNTSQIVYNCEICHTNCHTNSNELPLRIDNTPTQYNYEYTTAVTLVWYYNTPKTSETICSCDIKNGTATPFDEGVKNITLIARVTGWMGNIRNVKVNQQEIQTTETIVKGWTPQQNIFVNASVSGHFSATVMIKVTWSQVKV